jgi:hypothetical protein
MTTIWNILVCLLWIIADNCCYVLIALLAEHCIMPITTCYSRRAAAYRRVAGQLYLRRRVPATPRWQLRCRLRGSRADCRRQAPKELPFFAETAAPLATCLAARFAPHSAAAATARRCTRCWPPAACRAAAQRQTRRACRQPLPSGSGERTTPWNDMPV